MYVCTIYVYTKINKYEQINQLYVFFMFLAQTAVYIYTHTQSYKKYGVDNEDL